MVCSTIKTDLECPFMTAQGCSYNGGICHEIVESCEGCHRKKDYNSSWYCTSCPDPSLKWKNGSCNLATHVSTAASNKAAKINPLKASKRANS